MEGASQSLRQQVIEVTSPAAPSVDYLVLSGTLVSRAPKSNIQDEGRRVLVSRLFHDRIRGQSESDDLLRASSVLRGARTSNELGTRTAEGGWRILHPLYS